MMRSYEMNILDEFLNTDCEIRKDLEISATDLYDSYVKWANKRIPYVMSSTKFGIELKKRFERVHTKQGNVYLGIGLKL